MGGRSGYGRWLGAWLLMAIGLGLGLGLGTGCRPESSYVVTRQTAFADYSLRDGARLEYFNSKYWLLGGWQPDPNGWGVNSTTNEVWSSPDLITWTLELADDPAPPTSGAGARWYPRHTFMSCVFDGKLWVFGSDQYDPGGTEPNTSTDPVDTSVWNSEDGVTWTRVAADSLTSWGATGGRGCWDAIVGVYGGYMHIIGGYRAPDGTTVRIAWPTSSEHWRSQDGVNWEQMPDVPFSRARVSHAVTVGGRLVIVGGMSSPPPTTIEPAVPMNDVWTWDGATWEQTSASASWTGRTWVGAAAYDGKLWVLTGHDDDTATNLADTYWSSDFGVTWNEVDVPWLPSHADGVTVTAAGIAVVSGYAQGKNTWLLAAGTPEADYPSTQTLSAWWHDIQDAESWTGDFSEGLSGFNHLAETTNEPTIGTLDGHPTAVFNGTSRRLVGPNLNTLIGSSWTIGWMFKATSAPADPGAAGPYAAPGISDASGSPIAIGITQSGVRAGYHDGATWDSALVAASLGDWHFAFARGDATEVELSIDGGGFTSVARAAGITPSAALLRIGQTYDGTIYFHGEMTQILMASAKLSDEVRDNTYAYLKARYPSAGMP
jgi:hypothetical protein